MRALRVGLGTQLIIIGLAIVTAIPARALVVEPFVPLPEQTASPVIVSGYAYDATSVLYVQLFNKTGEVVDLTGWHIDQKATGATDYSPLAKLDGLLLPSNYVLVAAAGFIDGQDFRFDASVDDAIGASAIRLVPTPTFKPEEVTIGATTQSNFMRRNVSTTTGNYLSTFSPFTPTDSDVLYGGGLYDYPQEAGVRIVEIQANPRDCSPIDMEPECDDYVKLYNPTKQPIELVDFRLRSGFQGDNATSSNTYLLDGMINPGHYAVISISADNRPVTLTNSGGYVWLEDIYGVHMYVPTVQKYEDASSTTHKGQAWSLDPSDGTWKWTTLPTPGDTTNVFPVEMAVEAVDDTAFIPCQPNQYRSTETNRCRLIPVPDVTSLAACSAGEYRNPLTNRCRKVSIETTLTPCDQGEERNPDTNRCRSVAASSSSLKPCLENQERNPETNRCRIKTSAPISDTTPFPVEPIAQNGSSFTGWWALGGIGAVGVGYGISEWHKELVLLFRRGLRHLPFVR